MWRFCAVLAAFAVLAGCSTVETSAGGAPSAQALQDQRIQLKVKTGDDQMDALVYELAYQQFSNVMPLREKEPYTGTLEITFASTTAQAYVGTSTGVAIAPRAGRGWYTGGRSVVGTAVNSGTFLQWQNSTMLAVLKKADGERLWSADYSYKGGWELSGFVVNTPEEAARLIVKRLAAKFVSDVKK